MSFRLCQPDVLRKEVESRSGFGQGGIYRQVKWKKRLVLFMTNGIFRDKGNLVAMLL